MTPKTLIESFAILEHFDALTDGRDCGCRLDAMAPCGDAGNLLTCELCHWDDTLNDGDGGAAKGPVPR